LHVSFSVQIIYRIVSYRILSYACRCRQLIVGNFLTVKKFSTTATTAAIHVKTCCVQLRSPRQLRDSHHDCNRGRNRDSVNGV